MMQCMSLRTKPGSRCDRCIWDTLTEGRRTDSMGHMVRLRVERGCNRIDGGDMVDYYMQATEQCQSWGEDDFIKVMCMDGGRVDVHVFEDKRCMHEKAVHEDVHDNCMKYGDNFERYSFDYGVLCEGKTPEMKREMDLVVYTDCDDD